MRILKFRGLRIQDNQLIYGNLIQISKDGKPSCTQFDIAIQIFEDGIFKGVHKVAPESVGQFTGLHDKNGKEIYEGDILNVCNGSINGNGWFDKPYSVEFKCGKWDIPLFMWDEDGKAIMNYTHWCEVIGNIHENQDLLKTSHL